MGSSGEKTNNNVKTKFTQKKLTPDENMTNIEYQIIITSTIVH